MAAISDGKLIMYSRKFAVLFYVEALDKSCCGVEAGKNADQLRERNTHAWKSIASTHIHAYTFA